MQALEWLALAVAIQYHGAGPALVSKITGCGGQQARDAMAALEARGLLKPGAGSFCGRVQPLAKGMTNHLVRFALNGSECLLRIPGEGTASLLDRRQEYEVYQALAGRGISDEVLFFSPELGYKITRYIESAHNCDPGCAADVQAAMELLRRMHGMELRVGHHFDVYEKLEDYVALTGTRELPFPDWRHTFAAVQGLRELLERCPQRRTLCHIDPVQDNFLIGPGGATLIDWEYAAMCDADIDPAMFCIYAGYDQAGVERTLRLYHQGTADRVARFQTYAYMAASGLLWSYWCEYKKQMGVDYDAYEAQQYGYARAFSALAAQQAQLLGGVGEREEALL